MKKRNILILFLLIIILPAGTFFSYRYYQSYKEKQRNKLIFEKRKANWLGLRQKLTDEIAKFKGEAGIVIKDLEMNREISFNKEQLFPSASLAKIPIMAACFLAAEEGKLKLNQKIKLKPSDKLSGGGVLRATYPDTEFSIERLISLMIYESDNTATNILTNILGIDYLNQAFKSFELKDTELSRKIADYQSRNRGIENYTTAQDIASLLEKIYRRNLVNPVRNTKAIREESKISNGVNKNISEKCIGILKLQRINDRIPKYLPVDIMIAHKTGLEAGICHDAGIVFTRKGDFLICILTQHKDSNSNSAKEFIAKVALYAYDYFEQS